MNDEIYRSLKGELKRLLAVLPTGAGKSVCIAELVNRIYTYWGWRSLVVVHSKELVEQNLNTMRTHFPQLSTGKYLRQKRDTHEDIIFGSIQSMVKNSYGFGQRNLLIIDEAHRVSRDNDSQYWTFINILQEENPGLVILGFTATPYRMDSGRLDEPWHEDPPVFDMVVSEVSTRQLVQEGWLCPLATVENLENLLDVDDKASKSDFTQDYLDIAVNLDHLNTKIVEEIIKYGEQQSRDCWLIFASTISHSIELANKVEERGILVDVIHGGMSARARERAIFRFREGIVRALVNVDILTTGFDHPPIDLIALVRPTLSPPLHVQMLGRGMRLVKDGSKKDCLVLDFAGNIFRHGGIYDIDGSKDPSKNKDFGGKRMGEANEQSEPQGERNVNWEELTETPSKCGAMEVLYKVKGFEIRTKNSQNDNPQYIIKWTYHLPDSPQRTETVSEYRVIKSSKENTQKYFQQWWKLNEGLEPAPRNLKEARKKAKELKVFLKKVGFIKVGRNWNDFMNVDKFDHQKTPLYTERAMSRAVKMVKQQQEQEELYEIIEVAQEKENFFDVTEDF